MLAIEISREVQQKKASKNACTPQIKLLSYNERSQIKVFLSFFCERYR